MAACVSLVAVLAIAAVGAAFTGPWVETVSSDERRAGGFQSPARTHLFSFGLENASYVAEDPAGEDENSPPR